MVLRRDPTPNFRKFETRWVSPFAVLGFAGEHKALYKLERTDGSIIPNSFYRDYLRVFTPREGYLRPSNKQELEVVKRIRIQRARAESAELLREPP